MSYAELWMRGVRNTQPDNINQITSPEFQNIEKLAEAMGEHMEVTNAPDGHVIMKFTDGSVYNPVTGSVEEV